MHTRGGIQQLFLYVSNKLTDFERWSRTEVDTVAVVDIIWFTETVKDGISDQAGES